MARGFHLGDDGLECVFYPDAKIFEQIFRMYIAVGTQRFNYGLGYYVKSLEQHPFFFEFLSKHGVVIPGSAYLKRPNLRFLTGANYTRTEIGKNLTAGEFNYCVST